MNTVSEALEGSGDYRSRPYRCERLAKLEGQSNYLRLLAGIEECDDTSEDAAALGWVRDRCIPEALEAYWGGVRRHRYNLCQLVFDNISSVGEVKDRDRIWMKGAILDAYDWHMKGYCVNGRSRSRSFKVDYAAYLAARKLAGGVFTAIEGDARRPWIFVRFRS